MNEIHEVIPDEVIQAALHDMDILRVYILLNYKKVNDLPITILLVDKDGYDIMRTYPEFSHAPPENIKFGFKAKSETLENKIGDKIQITKLALNHFKRMKYVRRKAS